MYWLRALFQKINSIINGKKVDEDIDDELQLHIELRTEANIKAGMSPAEARRDATIRFGHYGKFREACREVNGLSLLDSIFQDLRFAARMLRRSPAFTIVAALALALGIGTSTAIFTIVNTVLLRPLPYQNSEQMVIPVSTNPGRNIERGSVSYADYLDYQRETATFEYVAVYQGFECDITNGNEAQRIQAAIVTPDFFNIIGIKPLFGRMLLPEEHKVGASRTAVISYRLWQKLYGGDPTAVGKPINLYGKPVEVVGIIPDRQQWPEDADLWVASNWGTPPPEDFLRRDNQVWLSIARLKKGVTIEQANAVMKTLAARVEQEHPESKQGWSAAAIPINEWIVTKKYQQGLLIIFGAVAFVLLIACSNVANLLLARASTREREIAIRQALGAGRFRLLRQLLTESLLLALLGGVGGVMLGLWGIRLIMAYAPADLPRFNEVHIDSAVFIFALGLSLLTALIFGLLPAFHATETNLSDSLKEAGRAQMSGLRSARMRNSFVIIEIALSFILLIGAGLFIRSFQRLQQIDPGIGSENLLTLNITAPKSRYKEKPQLAAFYQQSLDGIKAIPGVKSAASASALPVGGGGFYLGRVFLYEGQPEPPGSTDFQGNWNVVSPDYFNTMSIPLISGRDFNLHDTADSAKVIIINENLAKSMFGNESPLGKRIRSWRDENQLREIVGVVKDNQYFGLDDKPHGLVYVPHSQDRWRTMSIVARTNNNPDEYVGAIRSVINTIDKDIAVADVKTMTTIIDRSIAPQRFNMLLITIFSTVAMLLAVVGIYGVMTYTVTQRKHEIGIRMALGAKPVDVLKMILRQGMLLAMVGNIIGLCGAIAITRLLSSMLFGVSNYDPITYLGVICLLTIAAFISCYLPAQRAMKVDPIITMRCE